MAEPPESCCIRLKLSDGGHVYLKSVWHSNSFSITVLEGPHAWSYSVSENEVKSIAQCWAKTVLDFMRVARSHLGLQHPTSSYSLSADNVVLETVQLKCTIDNIWDSGRLNLELMLKKVPDVGAVVRGMLDLLIDTTSKLQEMKIEADHAQAILAQITALCTQSTKLETSQHVCVVKHCNGGAEESRAAIGEGNTLLQRRSTVSPLNRNFTDRAEGSQEFQARDTGRQSSEEWQPSISLRLSHPNLRTRQLILPFTDPRGVKVTENGLLSPPQDRQGSGFACNVTRDHARQPHQFSDISLQPPTSPRDRMKRSTRDDVSWRADLEADTLYKKSPGIGLTQGGTRSKDVILHGAFEVPLSENIMRLLNCLGKPGENQSTTSQINIGARLQEKEEPGSKHEKQGLRITEMLSAPRCTQTGDVTNTGRVDDIRISGSSATMIDNLDANIESSHYCNPVSAPADTQLATGIQTFCDPGNTSHLSERMHTENGLRGMTQDLDSVGTRNFGTEWVSNTETLEANVKEEVLNRDDKDCSLYARISTRRAIEEAPSHMQQAAKAPDTTLAPSDSEAMQKLDRRCSSSQALFDLQELQGELRTHQQESIAEENDHVQDVMSCMVGKESARNLRRIGKSTQAGIEERNEEERGSGNLEERVNPADVVDTGPRIKAGFIGQAQWSEWLKEAKIEQRDESWWAKQNNVAISEPKCTPEIPCHLGTPSIRKHDKKLLVSGKIDHPSQNSDYTEGLPVKTSEIYINDQKEASRSETVRARRKPVMEDHDTEVVEIMDVSREERRRRNTHEGLVHGKLEYMEKTQSASRIGIERKTIWQESTIGINSRLETIADLMRKGKNDKEHLNGRRGDRDSPKRKASSKCRASARKLRRKCVEEQRASDNEVASDDTKTNVPDADHYDFDQNRTESHVKSHQIWAVYDDIDGMPRSWAHIEEVVHSPIFRARVSWLHPHNPPRQASKWTESSRFSLSCGDFKIGRPDVLTCINCFSHLMEVDREQDTDEVLRIYPKEGEVWAIYKDAWVKAPKGGREPPVSSFRLVVILEEGPGYYPRIQVLGKVPGFRTLWQPTYQSGKLPDNNVNVFSHRVPAYKMKGNEFPNLPVECWDIDPAGLPPESCSSHAPKST